MEQQGGRCTCFQREGRRVANHDPAIQQADGLVVNVESGMTFVGTNGVPVGKRTLYVRIWRNFAGRSRRDCGKHLET
jgi:hypothetical protein